MHFQLFYKDKASKTNVVEATTEELDATIESLYKEGNALLTIIPHSFKEEYHTVCELVESPLAISTLHVGQGCACWSYGDWVSDSEEEILSALDQVWESRRE